MTNIYTWLNLQLFAGEGAGDGGGEGAQAGETSVDAGQQRLLELGVPMDKIKRRANRSSAKVPEAPKAEKTETERRLSATIQEKDAIIKEQSAQLAQLAQQVARIADKALITTSQQQYLTAMEKGGSEDIPPETPAEEPIVVEQTEEKPKKSFWSRLFHRE